MPVLQLTDSQPHVEGEPEQQPQPHEEGEYREATEDGEAQTMSITLPTQSESKERDASSATTVNATTSLKDSPE